ncbi:MAG: DUF2909 family protein, partial [Burkholderiales bacterium]
MKALIVVVLVAIVFVLGSAGVAMLRRPPDSKPHSARMARALALRVLCVLLSGGRLSMATPALPSTNTIATSTTTISAFMQAAYRGWRAWRR